MNLLLNLFISIIGEDHCDFFPVSTALIFIFLKDVDIFTGYKFCNSREANPLWLSAHINRNIRAGLKHATCLSESLLNLIFSKGKIVQDVIWEKLNVLHNVKF